MSITKNVLVVTGFDSTHLDLAEDMAASFRRAYQDRYPLAAIVFGGCRMPPSLASRFDAVVEVPPDQGFDGVQGYFLAYTGLKARLPELFPGYASYCWVDADCWFQGSESLPRIMAGVPNAELCIHPEFDVHYLRYPTPSNRTLHIYRKNEAAHLNAMPLSMPMVNAGVIAMAADSRIWALWARELALLRERHDRGESVYFSDQIPLHKIVYLNQVRLLPLRAVDNWQTYACLPLVHRASKSLRVPTPPHELIGIVHLAGKMKDAAVSLDGETLTLRYRDMARFLGW
ncbi:MAG: hypothetical protein QM772_17125 [Ottowia sp.]|uniref:hypothetical protein n=1 Tax=Ottowia sp. TaxID=1898956 RepID=UPI0039E5E141